MKLFSLTSMATPITGKPRLTLSAQEISLVLALEKVWAETATETPRHPGLRLICPRCAGSGVHDGEIQPNNDPADAIWSLDCDCQERRASRADAFSMRGSSAELIALAPTVLAGALMEIRCPTRRKGCRYAPLAIQPRGDLLMVTCGCTELKFKTTLRPH